MKRYYSLPGLILLVLFASCSNTRFLAEGESLYKGARVNITDSSISPAKKKELEALLASYVRPVPNSSFFGLKYKLLAWNLAGEPKKPKGLRSWLRNKIGEAPVLSSDVRLEMNNLILENQLFNMGYFHAASEGEKVTKNKRTTAVFSVITGPQYTFRSIEYLPADSVPVAREIRNESANSLLKVNDPYNLEIIKLERERLSKILNNRGYYFFNADYLLSVVDTAHNGDSNKVDLKLILKKDVMPKAAYLPFTINNIMVLPNYRFTTSGQQGGRGRRAAKDTDTIRYENYTVVDPRKSIRKIVYDQSIQFHPGEAYSESEQTRTLSRLIGTNLFKFVKNEFTVVRDPDTYTGSLFDITYNTLLQRGVIVSREPRLDVTYYLTQYPRKKISVEIGGYTLNDARYGTRLNFIWRNRNIFKGAELFSIKGTGGMEIQYGGENRRPNTYNVGAEASLEIPRFLVPYFHFRSHNAFLPKTVLTAKYDFYLRTGLYRIHSATLGLGYIWKEDPRKEHKLYPFNITYVQTDTIAPAAGEEIDFRNILFSGLIIGPTYEYTFNTQIGAKRKHDFYFNGLVDLSGNILGLIQKADYRDEVRKVFGNPYAQYIKLQADFRHYYNFRKDMSLASRLFFGYGIPYGNSAKLPNIKQFFAGGISSVRGFNARMIGPGTFNEYYLRGTRKYIEMLGDIKFEANVELRSKLYSFLHGAVFVDAGNVWLYRDDEEFPGGKFSKKLVNELAVATGLGLRFDFTVIMLRLDIGMPLRKPWLPEGDRWTFDRIKLGDGNWRRDNIVFGFAIGYPF